MSQKLTKNNSNRSKIIRAVIIGILVIFAGMATVFFVVQMGFCQGWWLRENLWANYWWYCDCGEKFERSLYPDNVEIVVPACRDPRSAVISPDGRYMVVKLGDWPGKTELILLDLVTGEERPFPYSLRHPDNMGFWTDTLFLVQEANNNFKLIDVVNNKILNLTVLESFPEALKIFQESEHIIVRLADSRSSIKSAALALVVDPTDESAENYVLSYPERKSLSEKRLFLANDLDLFAKNNIDYEMLDPYPSSMHYERFCASRNGHFLATSNTIFTVDEQVVTRFPKEQRLLSTGIERIG